MPSTADSIYLCGTLIIFLLPLMAFWHHSCLRHKSVFRRARKADIFRGHRQPKPAWVRREIIRIKAHVPAAGVRQVADIFNRNFAAATGASVLGIIDHGTRRCVSLKSIPDKTSVTLLKALIQAIETYGKPKVIRTDNESVFTSKLFRFGLRILGIWHRKSQIHCP